jgi:ABC-type antimicrobial peptide transport system permease subunit
MNSRVRLFSWAGNIAFLIVVVGISGIFILIIQKRYKQLCICHINGLTKREAFMQIFIEVLLLVSIPSIIGMILVITFQGKFNSIYYPIEWHPFTTVVFILLPIVITLIITVVSSSWLRHLNVVKWLKRIE